MAHAITPAELEAILARAGLAPGADRTAELVVAHATVTAMIERNRTPRSRAAEPANVFVPATGHEA